MKDLYTFDYSVPRALETYEQVRAAYARIFAELKLPVLVAQASSGDMGGDLSHEYHLPALAGEDDVITCNACGYVTNVEVVEPRRPEVLAEQESPLPVSVWRGVSKDRRKLVNVWYPSADTDRNTGERRCYELEDVNIYAVKDIVPDLDAGVANPLPFWTAALEGADGTPSAAGKDRIEVINIVDGRLPPSITQRLQRPDGVFPILPPKVGQDVRPSSFTSSIASPGDHESHPWNFLSMKTGDRCPKCATGTLAVQRAIELGHTFHLGTRYSTPLAANVTGPASIVGAGEDAGAAADKAPAGAADVSVTVPMQMGCHGIGVSRVLAAAAAHLSDARGLNWPRVIAPYEAVVVCTPQHLPDGEAVYDALAAGGVDAVLDDRAASASESGLPFKMKDADLLGYPVLVVLGRAWRERGRCEVQCRRLGVREELALGELAGRVGELLDQL